MRSDDPNQAFWSDMIRIGRSPTGEYSLGILSPFVQLLEILERNPKVRRFSFFTSMHWLRFSRCPNYPHSTWGLPAALPLDKVGLRIGLSPNWDEAHFFEGPVEEAARQLEKLLTPLSEDTFDGSCTTYLSAQVESHLAELGYSPLMEILEFEERRAHSGNRSVIFSALWSEQLSWTRYLQDGVEIATAELDARETALAVRTWLEGGEAIQREL